MMSNVHPSVHKNIVVGVSEGVSGGNTPVIPQEDADKTMGKIPQISIEEKILKNSIAIDLLNEMLGELRKKMKLIGYAVDHLTDDLDEITPVDVRIKNIGKAKLSSVISDDDENYDREDLINIIVDMVNYYCKIFDGEKYVVDSMSLSANAHAMRLLAKEGKLEILEETGDRIIGKWKNSD